MLDIRLLGESRSKSARNVIFDVDVAIPISTEGKYWRRLESFKRAGLFNLEHLKVHVTLVGGPNDVENSEAIESGWPDGIVVTAIFVDSAKPLPKMNLYYFWQRKNNVRARWRLRVDDDSMTDLGELIKDADRRYGDRPIHIMTEPFVNGTGIAPLENCLRQHKISLPITMHEFECSLTSDRAMQELFLCREAVQFLEASTALESQQSDQPLALAMLAAKVPMAINPLLSKDFRPDEITLAGGRLLHMHYVDWDRPGFAAFAAALVRGERKEMSHFNPEALFDRPLAFGRCIDITFAELTFLPNGDLEGSPSENETKWKISSNCIFVTRANGIITTTFNTLLLDGKRRWLIGPYLFEPYLHFIRLV